MISAVVLASASSSPLSEQDLFRPHKSKPLLQWILEKALDSDLAEVICVIGNNLTKARREIRLVDKRLFWYADAAGCHQNSASIIAGLWACHPQSQGAMFLSGRPPLVRKEVINALIDRFKRSSASIVTATLGGRPRGPLLVRRDLFPELLKLRDHDTEHSLLAAHKQQTALVEWHDMHRQPTAPAALAKGSDHLPESTPTASEICFKPSRSSRRRNPRLIRFTAPGPS